MDYVISGDEGWWTGKCNGKVGMISKVFFLEPKIGVRKELTPRF